ncbi:alpha/beta hydrolase family protein [Ceratobasidium sp. AG-Ba]|nr:alpha/beta hydrolase family protein [Ceratobasidium sp. AG-Ba]QRW06848.1 alpha/beta hydrolase family protein [Ceratobasidium sp. AG-Ba]
MADAGNRGFLKRAHTALIYLGGIYAGAIILLMTPGFQRQVLYMHALRFPLRANYDLPERYGLAPGKTLNLNLRTPDDVRLGAWFVAADGFYQQNLKSLPPTKATQFSENDDSRASSDHPATYDPRQKLASLLPLALQTHPTVLFFHGNAMTRAFHYRTRLYSTLTSRLNANVLAIDYRGFGDSEGTPSEQGLLMDARTAWDWLIENGAKEEHITIVGQSLGTGVSTGLAAELSEEGISPRGVVLLAPYTSIPKLLETYNFGGKLPLLQPLQSFRFVFELVMKFLRHRFDSLSIINDIICPITIIHAEDDWDIPVSHAKALFDSLLEPLLPAYPFDPNEMLLGKVSHSEVVESIEKRNVRRNEVVAVKEVDGLGTIRQFEREEDKGSVVMLETSWGEHNGIGEIEGVIDVIGWSVGLDERD